MAKPQLVAQIRMRREMAKSRPPLRKQLPRQIPPDMVVLFYEQRLRAFLADAERLVRATFTEAALQQLSAGAQLERGDDARQDAGGRKVKEMMDKVREAFSSRWQERQLADLAEQVAARTNRHQRDQLHRQLRAAVGVDVIGLEPRLQGHVDNFVEENVSLITSLPDRMFDDIEQRVQAGVTAGLRHEDLAKEMEGRFDMAEGRMELIARDQTLKFYGSLNEVRQKAMGLQSYTWKTALDERVRPTHQAREGKSYDWADADDEIIPGEEINCRCYASPNVDELLDSL